MSDLKIFTHFLRRLAEFPALKLLAGFFIWLIQMLFGTVCRPVYVTVIVIWLLDTLTGYYYAWSNPAVIPESRKMYHGMVKLFIYYGLLALAYQISRYGADLTELVRTTIEIAIILTESKSILENFDKIAKLKQVDIPFLRMLVRLVEGRIDSLEVKQDGSDSGKAA